MDNHLDKQSLLAKYLDGSISPAEVELFWAWLNVIDESVLAAELKAFEADAIENPIRLPDPVWDIKMRQLRERRRLLRPVTGKSDWILTLRPARWAAAAIFLVVASAIVFIVQRRQGQSATSHVRVPAEMPVELGNPARHNKAVLILGDGHQLVLDSGSNGELVRQGGVRVLKTPDGQLKYEPTKSNDKTVSYNTLRVPKGSQYHLLLSDGSEIWLNAASSLTYPTAFTGRERVVKVDGEAFFNIAKNPGKPFRVKVKDEEIEVLGTQFNVNGYQDEAGVKTSLVKGLIKLHTQDGKTQFLKPGQQSFSSSPDSFRLIEHFDLNEVVAWKDGLFRFKNQDIQTIMRQLCRWYDIDVSFQGTVNKHFIGVISRNAPLAKVLDMLSETREVKFEIDKNKIIVKP
jgi:ferric-dicitrate binding protein FerR (iron transport regulator)